ncbi:MAG: cardiolipin synthase [Pirellulaceae bacterium]|jgi:cardiolipin synthase
MPHSHSSSFRSSLCCALTLLVIAILIPAAQGQLLDDTPPNVEVQNAAKQQGGSPTENLDQAESDARASEAAGKLLSGKLIAALMSVMHFLGALTAIHAVMSTRTPQGAIAWAISAVTFPYIAVPAYWVFGRSKFDGYVLFRRSEFLANNDYAQKAGEMLNQNKLLLVPENPQQESQVRLLNHISNLPVTTRNDAELLIDGEQTFAAIFAGIAEANDYILVQFYILRDDELGQRLKNALIERAHTGVRVYVLYDELGSNSLSSSYISELHTSGVEIVPFNTTQGTGNTLRLNFRNHRKIVVVDGQIAYVGGHNVGDEYVGKDPVLSPWRDTHVALRGPIVQCVQVPFVEDWHWATGNMLELAWIPAASPNGNMGAACIPTGPADELETGTLWFLHAINSALERLWIVSPYFVPDSQLLSALQLAAQRGVDVRILIPQKPDHILVYLSALSYLEEAESAGVKIYRYQPGFLHQKVMLIDNHASAIGTANLDNRSMRLNFEITMLVLDKGFATEVETMLNADFAKSKQINSDEYTKRSLPFRFLVRVARLMAPVL